MRRAPAAIIVVIGLLVTGCGSAEEELVAPPRLDPALAPAEVTGGLRLFENRDDETVAAFATGGSTMLADGRIWELRRADRLVGTLQLSTVLPDVDLLASEVRNGIVRQIVQGEVTRLRIDGVEIFATESNDKGVYLWFGSDLYAILQVKDRQIEDYEPIVADVISHLATVPSWQPLPDVIEVT